MTQDLAVLHLVVAIIHATNAVKRVTWLEIVQMLTLASQGLHHLVAIIHVTNAVRRVTWQEIVQMLILASQDLRELLEAALVSNVAKRDIRREIAQMRTSVLKANNAGATTIVREEKRVGEVILGAIGAVEMKEVVAIEEGMAWTREGKTTLTGNFKTDVTEILLVKQEKMAILSANVVDVGISKHLKNPQSDDSQ